MASPRNPKSEALESYWESAKETSSTGNSMSTLLRSLTDTTKKGTAGLESVPEQPAPSGKAADSDAILEMCRQLAGSSNGWTLAEIVQNTSLGPAAAISAVKDAISLGLVAEGSDDPAVKRFRVTPASGRSICCSDAPHAWGGRELGPIDHRT